MPPPNDDDAPQIRQHRPGLIRLIAVACGLSVANLYYNQPLLADIARAFHTTPDAVGLVPTMTQVGYALGMLFIVPLGDIYPRRRLVVTLLILVTFALAAAALAPTLPLLVAASLAVGVTTSVPQILLPFAAQLTPPTRRGRAVGTIMMGLLLGILLSRTLAGFVGDRFGWRAVYWSAAAAMILLAGVVGALLPAADPPADLTYRDLLRSVYTLVKTQPVLRQAMLNGSLIFAAFSGFWATLAFRLEAPPLHYGPETAGLFGLVGAVGAFVAPVVGRLADKAGPRALIAYATAGVLASYVLFWVGGHTLLGLAAGVILLDLSVQAAQVTNMTRIYAVCESAPSRVNSAFMFTYFVGGALGSLLATQAWKLGHWPAVCALGCAFAALALTAHLYPHRRPDIPAPAPAATRP